MIRGGITAHIRGGNYHLMTATITATRFMLLLYFTFTFLPRCTTSLGNFFVSSFVIMPPVLCAKQ